MMAAQVALRRQQTEDDEMEAKFGASWITRARFVGPGYSQGLTCCSETYQNDQLPGQGQGFDCKY